jgi:hypothetical protein
MGTDKKYDKLIEERLKSADWDMMIAGKVLHHRRKRFAVVSGIAGLAFAASFLVILNFTAFNQTPDTEAISGFMSAQIDGSMNDADIKTSDGDLFDFSE